MFLACRAKTSYCHDVIAYDSFLGRAIGCFVPINQAAQCLGVCPDTVHRHVRMGLLMAKGKPRGSKSQRLVEFQRDAVGMHTGSPTVGEYGLLVEQLCELRQVLDTVTAEIAARRQEVALLRNLLGRFPDRAEDSGHPAMGPTETWRIPTDPQRERLLHGILAGGQKPSVYHLCDLLGWLKDQDREEEHDAVMTAVLTVSSLM